MGRDQGAEGDACKHGGAEAEENLARPAAPQDHEAPASLEAEIERVAPGAEVKLTLKHAGWRVRALAPAALCWRGSDFAGRDRSEAVARVLIDNDIPAIVKG